MTANDSNAFTPDTIVLIHGLWLTPRSWEHWVERYTAAGFDTVAPALARNGSRGRRAAP